MRLAALKVPARPGNLQGPPALPGHPGGITLNKTLYALMALGLVALAVPASAVDCAPDTDDNAVAVPFGGETYYVLVQNDLCQPDCLFSIWVYTYEETNGLPGLQRAETTCDGRSIPADEGNFIV